jgi:hypothetical protein
MNTIVADGANGVLKWVADPPIGNNLLGQGSVLADPGTGPRRQGDS